MPQILQSKGEEKVGMKNAKISIGKYALIFLARRHIWLTDRPSDRTT